jgi:hypothetical protein
VKFDTSVIVLQNKNVSKVNTRCISRDTVKKVFQLHCSKEREKRSAIKVSFTYNLNCAEVVRIFLKLVLLIDNLYL